MTRRSTGIDYCSRQMREQARALWGRDDPADAAGADDRKKQGNHVPREGHPARPPAPGDDRAFVRALFDN